LPLVATASDFSANGRSVVTIGDNGGGIAKEHLDRVFESFFYPVRQNGTGSGLHLSKTIVEQDTDGTMSFRNAPGGRTSASRYPMNPKPAGQGLTDVTLLYVEDEEHTLETVGELLKSKVTGVHLARNGKEGLHRYRELRPDIVVTDLRMPVMNGLDMARNIRALSPRAEIIVTSAHDDTKYLFDAIDLGIGQFVFKPVDKGDLFSAVDRSVLNVLRERMTGESHEWLEEMVLQRTADLDQAGMALEDNLKKAEKALQAVIQAMTRVVESRDSYTAGHQRKVAKLARSMAGAMGLDRDRMDGIYVAGVVHDIGKISVPAEILSKAAGLTDLEMRLIRTHSDAGHGILKGIDFPWPVAQIVLQHHERLDGSGYPQGLSGEAIMLEARVIAVADVVDAIASHRPYRPALGLDYALEEISRQRDTLYDPSVVDACLKLFREDGFRLV
jgi:putative two-component system response regulator